MDNSILHTLSDINNRGAVSFPYFVFPKDIQIVIDELHTGINASVDFIGCAILSAVSTAIGNSYHVQIKKGIVNNLSLYTCLVGQPGTAKSPSISFAYKPLRTLDYKTYLEYEAYIATLKDTDKRPDCLQTIYTDYTIEALQAGQKRNKRGISVVFDELLGWFKNFNRYNSGSEQEVWLTMWSGHEIKVNRKGSGHNYITMPFANVVGGIQPAVLQEIIKEGREHNGFFSRILFCYPKDQDKKLLSRKDIDPHVHKIYEKFINRLVSLELPTDEEGNCKPNILEFEPKAADYLWQLYEENVKDVNATQNMSMRETWDKLAQYIARFAGVIEIMNCKGKPEKITLDSVKKAGNLYYYFKDNMERVSEYLTDKPDNNKQFQRWIDSLPNEEFTTEQAVHYGEQAGFVKITIKKYLSKNTGKIFEKVAHGKYKKKTL